MFEVMGLGIRMARMALAAHGQGSVGLSESNRLTVWSFREDSVPCMNAAPQRIDPHTQQWMKLHEIKLSPQIICTWTFQLPTNYGCFGFMVVLVVLFVLRYFADFCGRLLVFLRAFCANLRSFCRLR